MAFIEDEVFEIELSEEAAIIFATLPLKHGVCPENDIQFTAFRIASYPILQRVSLVERALVGYDSQIGAEASELYFPVGQSRGGDDNQMRSSRMCSMLQPTEEGNRLNRFSYRYEI